jgi:AraC-like DNA-binding protein
MFPNANIDVDRFGWTVHLSEGYLRRKLKKITGLTPVKMFKLIRLDLARTYLESGKYHTIKEIAYSVGFQTADNFSKSYKAHFGKLPSDYHKTS